MSARRSSGNPNKSNGSGSGPRSAKDVDRAISLLQSAEDQLRTAADALLAMDRSRTLLDSLSSAADIIRGVREDDFADRARIEPVLTRVAAEAATVNQLFESATKIYFGRAAISGVVQAGYLADGRRNNGSDSAGSLRIEG